MGREEPVDSHPIINEGGGAWEILGQVREVWAVPDPDIGNLHKHMIPEISLLLDYLNIASISREEKDFCLTCQGCF
jgi:hypothetical protein